MGAPELSKIGNASSPGKRSPCVGEDSWDNGVSSQASSSCWTSRREIELLRDPWLRDEYAMRVSSSTIQG